MAPNRHRAATAPDPHLIAPVLAAWLSVFRSCFTAPVWTRVLVLVAPGKRTVTQALRVMGLAEEPQFRRFHEVLGRARWDSKAVVRRLLLDRLPPDGRWSSGLMTPSSGGGAPRSRRAASITTRYGPRRGTSSRPAVCAGCH